MKKRIDELYYDSLYQEMFSPNSVKVVEDFNRKRRIEERQQAQLVKDEKAVETDKLSKRQAQILKHKKKLEKQEAQLANNAERLKRFEARKQKQKATRKNLIFKGEETPEQAAERKRLRRNEMQRKRNGTEKCTNQRKEYRARNLERLLKYDKSYKDAHKDQIKEYREANRDKIKAYKEANKDKIKVYHRQYYYRQKAKNNT